MMTGRFDFRAAQSTEPSWGEMLLFNELYRHVMSPTVVALFEILDTSPDAEVGAGGGGDDDGWVRVAWAFLRLVGAGNRLNHKKRLRLQLFSFSKKRGPSDPRVPQARF